MFSQSFYETVNASYAQRAQVLSCVKNDIEKQLTLCTPDQAALVRWYYATMPLCDAAAYAPALLCDIAAHALYVRNAVAWCASLPQEIFLRDVAYYRINSEKIELYGPVFFEQLMPLVHKKSVRQAVLEINYWCAQHAAYTASDMRTASPLTVYRSGRGRCGEESTFLVAALRSVGIAARQVYTPRWAHCDDNHAWVEAFVEDKWQFLGACEPEEVLNRGWFTAAASRAMILHTRSFATAIPSDYEGETIGTEGVTSFYNATPLYANTKRLCIHVQSQDGAAVCGARITLEIVNMAEFSSLATLHTDCAGNAFVTLGLGDVMVCAEKDGLYANAFCSAHETQCNLVPELDFDAFWRTQAGWKELVFAAPPASSGHGAVPSEQQKQIHAQRTEQVQAQRSAWIASRFDAQRASAFPFAQKMLKSAVGNTDALLSFLEQDPNPLRFALLQSLASKDLLDVEQVLLEAHLQHALQVQQTVRLGTDKDGAAKQGTAPQDIFVPYVLCPRVLNEELTIYQPAILQAFSSAQRAAFVQCPQKIWVWIAQNIGYDAQLDYKTLLAVPSAALCTRQANNASRTVLFVAICRTLGIPARANPVSRQPEYYENGVFLSVVQSAHTKGGAQLTLTARQPSEWIYYKTWTLARWENNHFETLDYTDFVFDGEAVSIEGLPEGVYRLLCTARMPNGNQYTRVWTGDLPDGQHQTLALTLPEGNMRDFLMENFLEDAAVCCPDGQSTTLRTILKQGSTLVAFLQEGAEPTEHLLNELLEQQEAVRAANIAPVFVLRSHAALQNKTLAKVLHTLPATQYCIADFDTVLEPIARQMFVDHEKLPLLMVCSEGLRGRYACSGYNVGSVALCLKILRVLKGEVL